MLLKFPKNFLWGSSVSALQTEGAGITKKAKSIWNALYEKDPGRFYGQASPDQGVDSMRHYKEDLANMAKYGHNSFRNGFSWCRLFPNGSKPNPEAVKYYHDFLKEAGRLGLKRVMTLQHFEMPQSLMDKGGYASDEYPKIFAKYADFIFAEYGSEVEIFAIYNEPNLEVLFGYMGKMFPPMANDPKIAMKAWKGVVLSHALACDIFNQKYRAKTNAKIAAVHAVAYGLPKDNVNFSENDKKAANDFNVIANYAFLDAMLLGKIAPEFESVAKKLGVKVILSKEEEKILSKSKVDYVGMNFYGLQRFQAPTADSKKTGHIGKLVLPYKMPGARINIFRGWEINPEGLEIVANIVKNRYGNMPYLITENGMAVQEEWKWMDKDGMVHDDYRIAFVSEHLAQLHKDISNGANCIGYHMWSSYDCWSMGNGHKNTYGFIRVDIPTMKRFPKKSAHWYKEVLKNNGIDSSFKKVEETIDLNVSALPSANAELQENKNHKS